MKDIEHDVTELTAAMIRASGLVRINRRGDGPSVPGLEASSLELLDALAYGPCRITDLAAVVRIELSTLSRRITRLVDLGLVEKVTAPEDGRVQLAQLTDAGRAALERVQRQREEVIGRVVADWPAADVAELLRLVTRIADTLHAAPVR